MGTAVRLLVHALDRTGPPRLAVEAARILVDRGFDVDVVSMRGGPLADELIELGPVAMVMHHSEPLEVLATPSRRRDQLETALRSLPPVDVVVMVSVATSPLLGLDWIDPSVPIAAWTLERGEDLRWLDDDPVWTRRVDRWWAGAPGTAEELRSRFRIESGVVPEFVGDPGVSTDHLLQRRRAALGVDGDRGLVVGAGISTERKGIDLFAEAARRSAARFDGDGPAFVWIGGTDSDLFHKIRLDVDDGSGIDLRFVDPVPDVRPWLAAADVFLHTARNDAFPLVCLEAALAGVPVVGFAGLSALEEMFGDDAVTAPFPSVDELVDRVRALIDDGPLRASVGAAQRSHVMTGHIAASAGPMLADAVASLIETGRR